MGPLSAVRWRRGKLVCFYKEMACVKGRELTCMWFGGQRQLLFTTQVLGEVSQPRVSRGCHHRRAQSSLADVGAMQLLFGLLKFRFLSIPAVLDQ